MSNYGRNFEFLVAPLPDQRKGRFYNNEGAVIPIGSPVVATAAAAENAIGLAPVTLATTAQDRPAQGRGGLAIYEYAPNAFAGTDTFLTTYSDLDTIPDQAAIQLVSGTNVKVLLRNTVDSTYLQTVTYEGRILVAGVSIATPTLAVGDFLTPGVGDDTDGYWTETSTESEAWLVVTKVDFDRDEVEAQMMF